MGDTSGGDAEDTSAIETSAAEYTVNIRIGQNAATTARSIQPGGTRLSIFGL